ncbi:hypothetical protein JTE90_027175 [Oedothorax gibbosus]|uniref:C2H2-type domain-containing protein n=1 Tax=Oedothorax gibbosus TaxID=931172 RepID=A0AAV6THS1_9ARAC|nr:hypothetical protein JTE90_027175 [Oedothorax gibbosus]
MAEFEEEVRSIPAINARLGRLTLRYRNALVHCALCSSPTATTVKFGDLRQHLQDAHQLQKRFTCPYCFGKTKWSLGALTKSLPVTYHRWRCAEIMLDREGIRPLRSYENYPYRSLTPPTQNFVKNRAQEWRPLLAELKAHRIKEQWRTQQLHVQELCIRQLEENIQTANQQLHYVYTLLSNTLQESPDLDTFFRVTKERLEFSHDSGAGHSTLWEWVRNVVEEQCRATVDQMGTLTDTMPPTSDRGTDSESIIATECYPSSSDDASSSESDGIPN